MEDDKKTIFSGIQPSGNLTIGNYFGALKNWVKLQDEYNCFYCIVDLHAITVRQIPQELRRRTLEVLAIYIAAGLDPEKSTLFIQSHVPAHTQAAWLLNCFTYLGELNRMTQFKDKSQNAGESISAGLLNYPVLMAADILLYNADLVPVGNDQKQHLELTRDIATRFNNLYSPTFKVPEPYIGKTGARIMDLQEPKKKMSKSAENKNGYILIMDPPNIIQNKINRAVTDNEGIVRYSDEQLGVKNLMNILSTATGKNVESIEKEYAGLGYSKFKKDVAEAIIAEVEPLQKEVKRYLEDKSYLEKIYKEGAQKASYAANKTLSKMKRKIGFVLDK